MHDGEVVVLVEAGGALDSAGAGKVLQEALGVHGELVASGGVRYEKEQSRWRVRFATHVAAEAAVAALGAADGAKIAGALAVFVYYNGRPYDERGCASKRLHTNTRALHTLCLPSLSSGCAHRSHSQGHELGGGVRVGGRTSPQPIHAAARNESGAAQFTQSSPALGAPLGDALHPR